MICNCELWCSVPIGQVALLVNVRAVYDEIVVFNNCYRYIFEDSITYFKIQMQAGVKH